MSVQEDRREAFYCDHLQKAGGHSPNFDALSIEIAVGLSHTYDILQQQLSRSLARYGLSKSTVNILLILRYGPTEGMQLHDLGELLLVSRANVTGLIDHMESKGYVRRVVDPHDRRVRFARITKKARALLDRYMPVHYRRVKSLLRDLSSQQKQALATLLKEARQSVLANSQSGNEENQVA